MQLPKPIKLRSMTPEDHDFLCHLYATTRAEEMAQTGWGEAQIAEFLRMQFEAQHSYYQQHYPEAAYDVICRHKTPIGRLYLDRRPDEHRIIDIALLPEWRGKGLGGDIMRQILGEAGQANLPVRIHVERNNPALHLYQRLGFQQIDDHGVYLLMEWQPENQGRDRATETP